MPRGAFSKIYKAIFYAGLIVATDFSVAAARADDTTTTATPSATTATTPDQPVGGDECTAASDTGASGKTTDQAGKGNCAAKNAIGQAASALIKLDVLNKAVVQSALIKYTSNWQSCIDKQSLAAQACLENMSSNISDATSAANQVASTVQSASTTSSCTDFGKIMQLAQGALTAFSSVCATAKGSCISSCGDALSALDQLKSASASASCAPTDTACTGGLKAAQAAVQTSLEQDKVKTDKTSTAGKNELCTNKYADQLKSATTGIASMLAGLLQGNSCASATAATVDCTDASQAQTTTCLCLANPRLPGCDNSLQKVGDTSSTGITGTSATPVVATPDASLDSATSDGSVTPNASAASTVGGSSGAGAPIGGTSGPAAAASAPSAGGGKSPDTIIYAGYDSGKGGGAGSSSASRPPEKYRDYLPGGTKDPLQTVGSAAAGEITSQGGKSNWEKVRQRYLDNRPTLINN